MGMSMNVVGGRLGVTQCYASQMRREAYGLPEQMALAAAGVRKRWSDGVMHGCSLR